MLHRLKTFLWIASTPIALTILLAQPAARAQHDGAAGHAEAAEHGEGGHDGNEHHFVTNPVENLWSFSYRGLNTEGGEWVEGEHKMPPPFSMNVLNFAVFAFLLLRTAGPSIRKVVRERHDEIAKQLAESGRLRDEARARLEEYKTKVAGLDAEIAKLVSGIRAEAEAEKQRIIADAEARVGRMQRDAKQQIQAEMQQLKVTLEREAVEAAVSIAEKLLREKTGEADQRALADTFVKGLSEAATKRRPRA